MTIFYTFVRKITFVFTHRNCLIISGIFLLWLIGRLPASAQDMSRERELQQISNQLRQLSDSVLTGLRETASLTVADVTIPDFLRGLAQTHRLNISVDPVVTQRITNNFTGVNVADLLLFMCREYKLSIRFTGSIFTFVPYETPPIPKPTFQPKSIQVNYDAANDRLTADLSGDSLGLVVRKLTQVSKKNVVLAPGLGSRVVNGYIEGMSFDAGLDKIAYANGLRLQKTADNAYLLESSDAAATTNNRRNNSNTGFVSTRTGGNQQNYGSTMGSNGGQAAGDLFIDIKTGKDSVRYLTVDASNVPISDIIHEVSSKLGLNYVFFSTISGTTTVRIQQIRYEDLLHFLLQGTTHTFQKSDGVYLIGDRTLEGFRNTRLVRMQFRPADKIDELIPAELKKGVEVKVFKELNGVIMSGGAPQLDELTRFLKAIDQPVLNVLIEVIVAEMSKSHSIETGIGAFLSDSVKTTGGQIFPGLNMTIGAKGLNNVLQELSSRGIANLGRVTPNFYLTLKALEQNNYVNIRSTPKLSTLNGHEATLTIGQSVYYLVQTQNITGGVTPINSVSQQFNSVEANLVIKINPMVSGDEHITLDINAEFSDFIPPTIAGAPPGRASRKFTSMIRIQNEEMVMLGGLEEARKTSGGSGVPLLSRIPVLKWLFSSRNNQRSDRHLLVFIKPTLIY